VTYDDVYDELIARTYDAVYSKVRDPSGDKAFYFELACEGGPVLELGCGTGRILLPIARAGIECTGVDASDAMLRVFRSKNPPANLELVHGDMRTLDLGRKFRLVTIPFRAFQHMLDVSDQLACLACVRRHLAPGGTFAFDVFDPKLDRIALPGHPEALDATFEDGGREIKRFATITNDHTRQVITVVFRFEGGPPELSGKAEIQLRWFYRYEIEHLLARAGFTEVRMAGGFDLRPWTSGSEMIVLAR
jgi:ubiquinone/menaquinone biosynthesis C-methylase UbiE